MPGDKTQRHVNIILILTHYNPKYKRSLQQQQKVSFMQKHVVIASPCSVSSAAASIPSADWDIFSLVACCAWTPTELNTLAMKPPGILLVGGIIALNCDSLTASWPVATEDGANATGGYRKKHTHLIKVKRKLNQKLLKAHIVQGHKNSQVAAETMAAFCAACMKPTQENMFPCERVNVCRSDSLFI